MTVSKPGVIEGEYAGANIAEHFSRFKTVEAEETILHNGDASTEVYFILSGSVRITNYSNEGREIWHTELGSGTCFGEMAALGDLSRTSNVTAQTQTRLAVLTKEEFYTIIRHDPDISIWLMRELVNRVEEQTRKMSDMIARRVSYRIRAAILDLASRCQYSNDTALVIRPTPNITVLARRLNTDRETVSREISLLNRLGVIEKDKEQITLLKPEYFYEID